MKQRIFVGLALMTAIVLGTAYAQQHSMNYPQDKAKPASSMQGMQGMNGSTPMIFCPTMKTGQLCSHGTADALQLSGTQRDRWIGAVRRYNKIVEEANEQLQREAKGVLTSEQISEVNRWFAKGLNPEINQVLQNYAKKSQ